MQVTFKALNYTEAGSTRLYISWLAQVDPAITSGEDSLFVGFGAGTGALMLKLAIAANVQTLPGDQHAGIAYAPSISLWDSTLQTPAWTAFSPVPPSTWVTDATRALMRFHPSVSLLLPWGIPMEVSVGVELSSDPAKSSVILPSAANFKTSYAIVLNTPAEPPPPPGNVVGSSWPGTPLPISLPAPSQFADCRISTTANDPACTPSGTSIGVLDIGTRNSDGTNRAESSQIQVDLTPLSAAHPKLTAPPDNMFFAKPTFPDGTPAEKQALVARFRLADWGSFVGDSPQWYVIPGGEGRPFDLASAECHFIWPTQPDLDVPGSETRKTVEYFRNGTRELHQCMLVELSSSWPAGETFLNNSVYRNMDVVKASRFEGLATISVNGLKPIDFGPRDLFLYLETRNMPAKIEPGPEPRRPRMPRALGGNGTESERGEQNGQTPTVDEVSRYASTYYVHVYYDTGLRTSLLPGNPRILSPMPSFGYFATHEGELTGWAPRLKGAILIAENFYYLPVPNGDEVKITTSIQAVSPGESVDPEPPIESYAEARERAHAMGCLGCLRSWWFFPWLAPYFVRGGSKKP